MSAKLSTTQIADWKKKMLVKQDYICPLCKGSLKGIPLQRIAADHCHETGFVRSVLHMGCNTTEGLILKAVTSWGRCESLYMSAEYLTNLSAYWLHHRANPSPFIHPTHRTPQQLAAKAAKAKAKRLALAKKTK